MLVGHSLEEIRVRALQNVLSKLQHNLVCDADLVQEKHLHIRLLEWFNFATCPMQQQVLALVLRMSKVGFECQQQVLALVLRMSKVGFEGPVDLVPRQECHPDASYFL